MVSKYGGPNDFVELQVLLGLALTSGVLPPYGLRVWWSQRLCGAPGIVRTGLNLRHVVPPGGLSVGWSPRLLCGAPGIVKAGLNLSHAVPPCGIRVWWS